MDLGPIGCHRGIVFRDMRYFDLSIIRVKDREVLLAAGKIFGFSARAAMPFASINDRFLASRFLHFFKNGDAGITWGDNIF